MLSAWSLLSRSSESCEVEGFSSPVLFNENDANAQTLLIDGNGAVAVSDLAEEGVDRVVAHTLARNPASGRVLVKLGFVETSHHVADLEKWRGETLVQYALEREGQ